MPDSRSSGTYSSKEQNKAPFLSENLNYEAAMANFSYQRLYIEKDQLTWNAMYECFGVHARNLYDFFRNEGSKNTTFRADDYVNNWPKSTALTDFNAFDGFIVHLSKDRQTGKKPTLETLPKIASWLNMEWSKWLNALPPNYRALIEHENLCSPTTASSWEGAIRTACTVVQAVTFTSAPIGATGPAKAL